MTVKDLRDQLTNLPDTMRIVTPDFLDTYFQLSEVGRDTFVAIITDVNPVDGEVHEFDRRLYDAPEPKGFDPIGTYYTRDDESY